MNHEQDDEAAEPKEPTRASLRKGEGKMDAEELQTLVHGVLTDSVEYVDTELSPGRAQATEYYLGQPIGNEEEGRSQFVMTEVRDGVQAVLPSLLRMFFSSPDRVVEFVPRGPTDVQGAKQRTDYVQYVFTEDNAGFLVLHAAFKDALIRKIGVIKWGWDATPVMTAHDLDGVTQSQLEAITADDANDLTEVEETAPATETTEAVHKVSFTRTERDGRPWVKCIPPEELLITRETREVEGALMIGHRTDKTRGDLIAMNIDEKEIDAAIESGRTALKDSIEETARRGVVHEDSAGVDPEAGEANEKLTLVEAYMNLDIAGKGTTQLYKVLTVGAAYHVVGEPEPVDDVPFAIGCPDPEPHTLVGGSWADRLMDLQRVNSSVVRATLDSLALSIFPRTAYEEGQVSVEDILNTEIGAPIRMRKAGAVVPFAHPFTGEKAFPFFELFKSIKEGRTGQGQGPSGLDADALQSSTPGAVEAATTAAQEHKELLARLFAETLVKPMFRGLYRLLAKHKPKSRMVKLSNTWVAVDPSTWGAECDVTVNVALGQTAKAQRIAVLDAAAAKQELILQTLGPQNPMVSLTQYSSTLIRAMELNGFPDAEGAFFTRVPEGWTPPAPQGPPPPTPEQTLAQASLEVEKIKSMRALTIKERELELKEKQLDQDHAREAQRLAAEMELKRYELELKYHADITSQKMNQDAAHTKMLLDAEVSHRAADHEEAIDTADQVHSHAVDVHSAALAQDQQAHDQSMDEQAAAEPTA